MDLAALPLFPLGLVLYPEEHLPLHIFEPRYLDLVEDCLSQDIPFGIVLFPHGKMSEVGCTATIAEVESAQEAGEKDIIVTGMQRFRILEISRERSYLTAEVEALLDDARPVRTQTRERVIAQHIRLLEIAGRLPRPTLYQGREYLSFFIAHNTGLTIDQKQSVLEMNGEAERLEFLVSHLERFIPMVEDVENMRKRVRSNGRFKDFPPKKDDSVSN